MPQTLVKNWMHIVFSTKKRQTYFSDMNFRHRMHDYIAGICRKKGCVEISVGGIQDHVHLLINVPKTFSISEFMRELKSVSSKWVNSIEPFTHNIQKFQWQRGYGAFSVSHSNIDAVRHYINTQVEHHKKFNYEDELRQLLNHHEMKFDERYLWD